MLADWVPLANKGEEAIVRGIEDIFRDDRPVEIGVFDNVNEVTHRGNITVFPREWVFRVTGGRWSRRRRILKNVLISVQMRFGYYSRLRNLLPGGDPACRELQEFFELAQYVVVGHDGVFCAESCGVIHLAKKDGKRVGILGSGTAIGPRGRLYLAWLCRRAMEESDFCVFRDRYSYESMRRLSSDPDKLILAPDPAFAMRPAEPEAAHEVLERCASFRSAGEAGKRIVGATVLETGVVYDHFMPGTDPDVKREAHAGYLAGIFDALIRHREAFVVFLPHSVEGYASDVVAAQHVTQYMTASTNHYMILNEDLPARVLKSIIRECDFLVGERTHSVIASVCVATPFVALTNRRDHRTHGILGKMCRCENQVLNMDCLDQQAAQRGVLALFDERECIQQSLRETCRTLTQRLTEVARIVRVPEARMDR